MFDKKYADETGKIIGASMEVHNHLGSGFQEVIYQRALAFEFELQGIPYQREFEMPIYYKHKLMATCRVDFFVFEKISVEIKAVSLLDDGNLAQAINYLEAYNLEVGLLINFGSKKLQFHRFANQKFNPGLS
jgi:GxxExxY protein